MDIQVKDRKEDLICSKHKEKIKNQQFSCLQCSEEISNQLKKFENGLMEYKKLVIPRIDLILRIITQWQKALNVQNFMNMSQDILDQQELEEKMNNNSHLNKLLINFNQLLNQEELTKCDENLQSLSQFISSQSFSQEIKKTEIIHVPKKCQIIGTQQQKAVCLAIAFNREGSLMVAGCASTIKVWQFDKQMIEQSILTDHEDCVNCLVFSKKMNWFASGSDDYSIIGWKQQGLDWISTSPQQHSDWVMSIVLNNDENELISCSRDKAIKVWELDCKANSIRYNYTLETKHKNCVNSLSLNDTALVSCSDDQTIILWMKGLNQKWQYTHHIKENVGFRVCFLNDTQFLFQPAEQNYTQIFQIENQKLSEQQKLTLRDADDDFYYFPTIYNEKRQIIIQKHNKYIYFIQKQNDDSFKIVLEPIECECMKTYGSLTEDGEYLVIWNFETRKFLIHQISY